MALASWICLLYSVSLAAAKVKWDAPTSTKPDAGPFGYMDIPRPTTAPAFRNPHGLRKRAASDQVCGYISSVHLPEFEVSCGVSFTCTSHSSLPVLGCCYQNDYCNFDTTCYDSTACGTACISTAGSLTLVCSDSALPYCASYAGTNSLLILICATASTSGLQPFEVKSFTSKPSSSTPASTPADATTLPGSGLSLESTTSAASVPTAPAGSSNNSTSTNTGAIAGGVVGGVAVIAIGLLGFFLIRRRSKKSASASASAAAGYPPVGPGPQPQPGVGYYPTNDKAGVNQQQQHMPMPIPGSPPPQQLYGGGGYPQQQPQYSPPIQAMQQPLMYQQPPPQPPPAELGTYEQRT
ncbi:hypothetical protein BZA05DRAFT_443188 [Tricharina praecox]|uniref:uncharacterized protein n=1 Tax=Tricharina praecox TaxID=43433 RepID=UPI0022210AF6|nr:uncharacterized protein BZA05DRAFT_443188 [Tricharina praecox]KAI5855511.1 hypothetical protein BZA05DRAFT_443188 [Tricharina praecox]